MTKHGNGLESQPVTRRRFIQGAGATAAAVGLGSTLGPLASAGASARRGGQAGTIKLGYVTPRTGPLAAFGEADAFTLKQVRRVFKKGLKVGKKQWDVEILPRDSQSDPDEAASAASDLILADEIDLMLVTSTPETTNPVADVCEANGMPCISTMTPWQPYFVGRGGNPGDPDSGFEFTYHFFWGLEDISATFLDMWSQITTNKKVGGFFPNDGDGQAWSDPTLPFTGVITDAGFTITNPGLFPSLSDNFSSQIAAYKEDDCEILTGVPIPPDFTTLWTQAQQQDFIPTIATVGKCLLFPSAVDALGDAGENLSTENWWSPTAPFTSSLTGQTCKQLANQYEKKTGNQWTQPIGFAHAGFEVGADVLKRSGDPKDKEAVLGAIIDTDLETIGGPVKWGADGIPKNIAKTPMVGGQWVKSDGEFQYDLIVVSNSEFPDIPKVADLQPITGS